MHWWHSTYALCTGFVLNLATCCVFRFLDGLHGGFLLKLKIGIYCKFKLVSEDFLKTCNVVLFVKQQHGFFVVQRVHGSKG